MKGISLKLFQGMMILVTIMLACLWLFQIVFLEDFYSTRQIRLMQDKVSAVAARINTVGWEEPGLTIEIQEIAEVYHSVLGLYDSQGTVILEAGRESGEGTGKFYDKHMRELAEQTIQTKTVTVKEERTRTGAHFLVVACPSGDGVLAAAVPLAPVADTVSILKSQLAYVTGILLVIAFLLSLVLSRRFVRPIQNLSTYTRAIAQGGFAQDFAVTGNDEIAALSRDIREMGHELGRTEQLRKELIGNISHELRTPLSLIKGYAETLRDVTGHDSDKRTRQLGIIIQETDRLSRLVDDILSMSRLDSGVVTLSLDRVDLSELARQISERFMDLSDRSGIRLTLELETGCTIRADRRYMEQVLVNLLSNAIRYARETVTISVSKKEDQVELRVADDGPGIPPEELARIWERYYKGAKSTNIGTGLGLAIVKSILESHGFSYGAQNLDTGGASLFFAARIAR
ncbi:HAMP domain-containing histidine kinase [Clostridiaceae bacterium HFYG-1003]|nr:HAMP domain-containing histidine kinase [Clostridiaceae bacterium HFYG-1003]